jgi:HEAT repeat protein
MIRLLVGSLLFALLGPAQAGAQPPSRLRVTPEPFATTPPAAWQQQDPADSVYQRARLALNRNEFERAAELFRTIRTRYGSSAYAPDAWYWEAFAFYKTASPDHLRRARELLRAQGEAHPNAPTRRSGDAQTLETRIRGELARFGDEEAARRLAEQARRAAEAPAIAPTPPVAPGPPAPGPVGPGPRRGSGCDAEDDVATAALNALLNMRSDRAIPILRQVLARRDPESVCLRRKAIFLVSQHEGAEVERVLLDAARSDPDLEVREQAVFWLSQVESPRAVAALDSILGAAQDRPLQEKAIFALSQHDSPEAHRALRRYVERSDVSEDLREKAIFWLGQSDDPESGAFLRGLYGRVTNRALKERILFSVAQSDAGDGRWLAEIARNQAEPIELRKTAIFWLGQRDETTGAELASIYGTFADREMKEQLIFVLSQKDDRAAVDKLFEIARREPDPELRKKAIFWLGQSDDPRVADLLAELLRRP